jgi:hypothetical protein
VDYHAFTAGQEVFTCSIELCLFNHIYRSSRISYQTASSLLSRVKYYLGLQPF